MSARITIMVVAFALAGTGFISKGTWVVDAESRLSIEGSTNVNKFNCRIGSCTGADTLQYIENDPTRELRFTRGTITVPIRSFDCGAKSISEDFWKTLRAETHPNLEIKFISLENIGFKDQRNIKGVVDISLAGSTTRYTICYQISVKPNGNVLLQGVHEVNFSDFHLVAPQKLKGLIKVREGLSVEFNLVLKEV